MPYYTYKQAAKNPGIVTNIPTDEVYFSTGRNVRARPGALYKSLGQTLLATVTNNLPIRALFNFKAYDNVWRTIVCCDTKIYSYTNDFASVLDITPAGPPSSGANDVWQFALIGGMPIISNGINPVWKWGSLGSAMTLLTNAPKCKALYVHQNRVIMGNITEGAYDFPARVRWSDISQPIDWSKDLKGSSGAKDLINSATSMNGIDRIQGFTHIGSKLIVGADRNIWFGDASPEAIDYTWSSLDRGVGWIAPRAYAKSTFTGLLYFMGETDFYSFSIDRGLQPIGFNIQNACFPNLNKPAISTAFAYDRPATREIVFCVPTGTNTTPDTAFVYREDIKAWTIEDCAYNAHTIHLSEANFTWDTLPYGSWDTITDTRWDLMGNTGIIPYEVGGDNAGRILKLESGNNKHDGAGIDGYIETGDMAFGNGVINKIVDEIVPLLKPQTDVSALMVQVGTRDSLHKDIDWSLPVPFTIGVSRHTNVRKMGKYVRLRFYSNIPDSPWVIEGYQLKYSGGGSR